MSNVITLLSNASIDRMESNTLSKFTNIMPRRLPVKRRINNGVSLQSVSFNAKFANIPEEIDDIEEQIYFAYKHDLDLRTYQWVPQYVRVPIRNYSTIEDFCSIMNKQSTKHPTFKTKCFEFEPCYIDDAAKASHHPNGICLHVKNCQFSMVGPLADWLKLPRSREPPSGFAIHVNAVVFPAELRSQGLPDFNANVRIPKYISVKLDRLHNIVGTSKCSNTLYTIPFFKRKKVEHNTSLFSYDVKQKEFGLIDMKNYSNLSVTLVDERDVQLRLDEGQATIVRLSLHRMVRRTFTLRISTLDKQRVVGDHGADIVYQFQDPLDLDDTKRRWEIALTSIIYPGRFMKFLPSAIQDFEMSIMRAIPGYASVESGKKPVAWDMMIIPIDAAKGESDLITMFNKRKYSLAWKHVQVPQDICKDANAIIQFLDKQLNEHTRNIYNIIHNPKKSIIIRGNEKARKELLANKAEQDKNVSTFRPIMQIYGDNYGLVFRPSLAYALGVTAIDRGENVFMSLDPTEDNPFTIPPNFDRTLPSAMFLHTNIIEAPVYGDGYAQVLKVIPIMHHVIPTAEEGGDVSQPHIYESEHLDFIRLCQTHITVMKLQLTRSDGEQILFEDHDAEVLYNFMFRAV